ncbi:MAG: hypothetical protein K4571_02405 [Deltaproteobacteria bacterium]
MGRGDYYRVGKKDTTDDYLSISITSMNRYNVLRPGRHSWGWRRNGELFYSLSFYFADDCITFFCPVSEHDGNHIVVNDSIPLNWTPCNFGGKRPWFVCNCGRRVSRLFIHKKYIACRDCFKLVYVSQREDELGRLRLKIEKMEARLENGCSKPKGMHLETFKKFKAEILESYIQKEKVFDRIALQRFPGMQF